MSIETAVAVVSLVTAGKTMIDGLSEGNLMKAVMGGVGAYYGMQGVTGGGIDAVGKSGIKTNGVEQASSTAGANIGDQFTATQTMKDMGNGAGFGGNISDSVNTALNSTVTGASDSVLNEMGMNVHLGGSSGLDASLFKDVPTLNTASNTASTTSNGLLDKITNFGGKAVDWIEENPNAAGLITKVGGGLLEGIAQQDMLDQKLAALEESRKRKQTTGNIDFLKGATFDPNTGRFA